MVPSFNVFKIDLIGDVLWRDTAESPVAAKVSIEKLATSSPGEYLIFDQKTGLRVLVTLPGVSTKPGSQAILRSILKPVAATRAACRTFRSSRLLENPGNCVTERCAVRLIRHARKRSAARTSF
jgi:hypothetical protein